MKIISTILATLALAICPSLALAHTVSSPAVRVHSSGIHDHTPQAHVRSSITHH